MIERKPWLPLGEKLPVAGQLGVYQLADDDERILFTGMAGGRSRFGLAGEIADAAARYSATLARFEITSAYLTRYREVLMRHKAAHGELPPHAPELVLGSIG